VSPARAATSSASCAWRRALISVNSTVCANTIAFRLATSSGSADAASGTPVRSPTYPRRPKQKPAAVSRPSAHHLWLPGARRHAPIDPFRQHRQLRRRQRYSAFLRLRPYEFAALQPLGIQHKALAIPSQDLQKMASAATEQEQCSAERISSELLLDHGCQTIKAA